MLKIIFAAVVALLASIGFANAQALGIVTGGCGTGNLGNGIPYLTVDSAGRNCIGLYYGYSNITGQSTTVVKSSAGVLHSITFNAPAATETVTIFDNTAGSGTKIGTITTPASPVPVTLTFDVAFSTGLTIVTATASGDITVSYK